MRADITSGHEELFERWRDIESGTCGSNGIGMK